MHRTNRFLLRRNDKLKKDKELKIYSLLNQPTSACHVEERDIYFALMNKIQSVQECDATKAQSMNQQLGP